MDVQNAILLQNDDDVYYYLNARTETPAQPTIKVQDPLSPPRATIPVAEN